MEQHKRIVIVSGGALGDWALREIRAEDVLIGVDRGALFLVRHGFQPACSLGDFDSVTAEELAWIQRNSRSLTSCDPVDKDLTDTEMALSWALAQHPREIVMLGVTGSRLDHTLANIHLLYRALQAGISCRIVDEKNEVALTDRRLEMEKGRFSHVSLLPFSMQVTGITLSGFQYPLHKASLSAGDTLGISNVLVDAVGTIEVESGLLLVIRSMD